MRFFRLIYILWIFLWFRLDEFIAERVSLQPLYILIKTCLFWRSKHQHKGIRLRLALEKLGPIFVKFGQMLSTRRDLLPPDIADELAKLQDKVPPVAFDEVKQVIETAFNQPLNHIYPTFDQNCIASASVAQVHFATLKNGKEVAVKILRPNIDKVILKDLRILNTLAYWLQTISNKGKQLKPVEIVEEFARHTRYELDLTLEAANCSQLSRNFSDRRLLIPEVHWDYCRKSVMTMQRMHGTPVSQVAILKSKNIALDKLAHDGVEIFFTQVFRDGYFHADMHPGNIQIADDGRFIALDFGIMGSLNEADKYYLARNFLAFFNRDYRDIAVAHIESGWVPKDTNAEELETAIRAICEPIFNRPLQEISFGRTLLSLFQMSRKFGVIIQPQLIMLQKTLMNIEGLGRDLDPSLDLWKTAKPFLKRWTSEQMGLLKVTKTIKKELPFILRTAPQIPRLIHQFLSQEALAEQDKPLRQTLDNLITIQHQQTKWQQYLTISIICLTIIVIAGLLIYWIHN